MTTVPNQEDLEARIARIKKRNEEIEKKHREAEADRLMAMKENAMVEIKPPKDDDWPREHKYDKIEFTYDLDADALAELEEKKKEKNAFIQKIAKDYKVFAEGEGPPPDPAYSFLADVERDGEKIMPTNINIINKSNKNNFERKNPNNRSGRLLSGSAIVGSSNRGRGGIAVGGGKSNYSGNLQRSLSTNEHDGRSRPEHSRFNNTRTGGIGVGSGTGEGRWRRDWEGDRSKDDNCIHNQSNGFKVTSPPIIGSGRVGPRQPAKPQFQFQTTGNQPMDYHSQHGHPQQQSTKPSSHQRSNNENFNRNVTGRKSDKEAKRTPRTGGQQTAANKLAAGGSVQDRLNRNRVVNIDRNENTIKVSTNGSIHSVENGSHSLKTNATLKTISKIIEKNAEIDEKLARQMHHENEKMASRMKELRMQDGA
ncbi:uncharacterized protein LOC131684407 isoform X2 [Topomyia yanbarensis]|uniref:uncharacterized protein LOC131684407 isoform X2 n=1 Tax=Topomyia yanbarensis TaxID=2498891 RepID=UPI00273C84B1|nr:uncharacterized protein LOC131684407 isoform X2 [Topomyia yanbarensis]